MLYLEWILRLPVQICYSADGETELQKAKHFYFFLEVSSKMQVWKNFWD